MVKKEKIKTKSELLSIMNEHLLTQQSFAENFKAKAKLYVDVEDDDEKSDKKKRNQYVSAYNAQVDAVSRTVSTLIKLQGSSLSNDDEEEIESLID